MQTTASAQVSAQLRAFALESMSSTEGPLSPEATPTSQSIRNESTDPSPARQPQVESPAPSADTPNHLSVTDAPPSDRRRQAEKTGESQPQSARPSREHGIAELFKPYLILENTASVGRDHLASERTYLAYVRTSLVFASTGVVLVQLFAITEIAGANPAATKHLKEFARPLGATVVLAAILVLLIGFVRYFAIQNALQSGLFPIARACIGFITLVLAVMMIIVFVLLLVGRS